MIADWDTLEVVRVVGVKQDRTNMKKGPKGKIIAEFDDGGTETLDFSNLLLEAATRAKAKAAAQAKKDVVLKRPAVKRPAAKTAASSDEDSKAEDDGEEEGSKGAEEEEEEEGEPDCELPPPGDDELFGEDEANDEDRQCLHIYIYI